MKLFEKLDMNEVRETWAQKDNLDTSVYGGAAPAFTPAIQGQNNLMNDFSGITHYASLSNVLVNYEYSGWLDECLAISKTGYIGDWSWLNKIRIKGPDVIKCMEQSTINGFQNFPVGKGRHIISVLPNGKMIGDGIAFREADDQILCTGGTMVKEGLMIKTDNCDVSAEDVSAEIFNFHVQGPISKTVLEKVCGEDLGDIEFVSFRDTTIAGRSVRIYRGGMSGEIGFELFGSSEDGSVVWNEVYETGKEYGLRQLGLRSMMVNHLQAYFPTIWVDFIPAVVPGAEAVYRSPIDFGWGGLIDKTRDFPGKEVLLAEMENPATKCVTIEFNKDDCMNIFKSLLDAEEEAFEPWPMPVSTSDFSGASTQFIPAFSKEQQMLGLVSNRGYSAQFKTFLGLAHLPIAYCDEGTEILVLYGTDGKRQTMLRATVARTPYKKDSRK